MVELLGGGPMNSRGIYILPDRDSKNIAFYDLTSFETPPVIASQSGKGYFGGSCDLLDDETAVCATQTTGDIYKYELNNNYLQQKIVANNPSGDGFEYLLVTKEKHILTSYKGCIYIYTSSGNYLGYSDDTISLSIYQMKEVKSNIIVTAQQYYVYLYDISNPEHIITHKLFDYKNTKYFTIEGLEFMTGTIAIGGYDSCGYGYVELFSLDEDNATLHPLPNKHWSKVYNCWIRMIREFHKGVLIFGGDTPCKNICTWEYAVIPHKQPICFPLLGRIWDIIPLPQ